MYREYTADFGSFSFFWSHQSSLDLVQNNIKAATSILIVSDEDNCYEIMLWFKYMGFSFKIKCDFVAVRSGTSRRSIIFGLSKLEKGTKEKRAML
ncbi:hypothetical protein I532_23361 [Brevibacillus borstelensis AK1]|uniref:Uncharacterized protein n=1 Tax=Brevibacillus borstelensis AK1 TaxID=1300222 RepID=M8DA73_9BACL|nr:hypothetical protein I532_23361 [Brevibacillus borstelensis AK1]